jgi:hypothetical protein
MTEKSAARSFMEIAATGAFGGYEGPRLSELAVTLDSVSKKRDADRARLVEGVKNSYGGVINLGYITLGVSGVILIVHAMACGVSQQPWWYEAASEIFPYALSWLGVHYFLRRVEMRRAGKDFDAKIPNFLREIPDRLRAYLDAIDALNAEVAATAELLKTFTGAAMCDELLDHLAMRHAEVRRIGELLDAETCDFVADHQRQRQEAQRAEDLRQVADRYRRAIDASEALRALNGDSALGRHPTRELSPELALHRLGDEIAGATSTGSSVARSDDAQVRAVTGAAIPSEDENTAEEDEQEKEEPDVARRQTAR